MAILYAIETIPPFTMTAIRFFFAGLIMAALSFYKKERPLTAPEKKIAWICGILLVTANALVCVVEMWIPSGLAAVVVGAMPIWMILVAWLGFHAEKPSWRKWMGAFIGLAGILLIASERESFGASVSVAGSVLILIGGNILWAIGTLIQRNMSALKSPLKFSQSQMLWGSLSTLCLGFIFESPWTVSWSQVSWISILSVAYLVTFGSVIGYTAYAWLARNVESHKISTYALVNPIIAVFLGWLFNDEAVSRHFLISTCLVLLGLVILFWKRSKPVQ